MEPIRILQVFTILNRGGAESMIMNYYRNMDRNKVQFDFLVHRPEIGAFEEEIKSMGGNIYRLPSINPFNLRPYYKALDKFFKNNEYKYDVIHSHINTFSSFPLKVASDNNIGTRIAHAHIALEDIKFNNLLSSKKALTHELKKLVKYYQRRNISKDTTHLFSCGEKAGHFLFNGEKFKIIENAIDTQHFTYNANKREDLREKLNVSDKTVIGHVGRFNEQKNHTYLLKIFREINLKNPNTLLVLIGDGNLKKEIEELSNKLNINNNILFMGVRSDIPLLLQMMDIFLFPSLYEGLPVTLIEAQAAGLKIFASDTITKEVALTDDIKFLSLDDKPEYWADQIRSILPYERKNNFEQIKQAGYDIKENARRLQEFYLNQASK